MSHMQVQMSLCSLVAACHMYMPPTLLKLSDIALDRLSPHTVTCYQ